ncbi:A24 family peptidase C-terminal domain-containing protein [Natronosalvus halobius]|uniref:A24 family peptidase C-terminal domain-containing protein n=1 Tax=Natronosalvus halobius TaxID=2953746 RepID=UPI00209FA4F7|nr:A24 family peptidase C-terminal domain-containing protein [Natronosalvus halobius]USZ73392.1 prepilin peptidase [Natronosalvus halobius]
MPDLLRLVAVPVFAWAAVRDVKTRRISSSIWIPLSALAVVLFVWDGWVAYRAGGVAWSHEFLVPSALSLGVVVPLAYLFWWFGGFGGADAKALLVLALLFPTYPTYALGSWTLPAVTPQIASAFSLAILTNAVLLGVLVPVVLAIRNAAAGRIAPVMFVGWPIEWTAVSSTHGRLLDAPSGRSLSGLDLDALRMYLRWRGLALEELRTDPETYRDPATLPDEPNPPTDGAVTAEVRSDGGSSRVQNSLERDTDAPSDVEVEDPWGAAAFLEDIDGTAYGTDPETLRDGLEVLVEREVVWVSPGTPFLVPIFAGLVVALVYGDLLLALLF